VRVASLSEERDPEGRGRGGGNAAVWQAEVAMWMWREWTEASERVSPEKMWTVACNPVA